MWNGKRFNERLANGQKLIGGWVSFTDPSIAEIMAGNGYDFLIVDMEHGPLNLTNTQGILMAFRETQCASILRVPWNEPWMVKHALDIGADGIMFPFIMDAEEARKAVAATRYAPRGNRGFSPRRASQYGARFDEYFDQLDGGIAVVLQIEHIDAVNRVEEIASVEGVNCVFVGPADLTASLGKLPNFSDPEVVAASAKVGEVCSRLGVPWGVNAGMPAGALRWAEKGAQFLTCSEDSEIFVMKVQSDIAEMRAGLKPA